MVHQIIMIQKRIKYDCKLNNKKEKNQFKSKFVNSTFKNRKI